MENTKVNGTFRVLSAIGIVLIVAGHADFQIFDLGGLFPYYSFHVAVFLFISGYFYKEEEEERIGAYIKRKALKLLLPYFIWNLFYGILAAALKPAGFMIGGEITIRTLFIDPFLGGHQFGYNFPAWFVPALFLIEVINVCMRKLLTLIRLKKECLIMAGCLLAGVLTVWLAIGGHVWGYYKLPGRILFMLPVYELGQLYKKKLEKWDRAGNLPYFITLLLIQLTIVLSCGGLAYSMVWCSGFANGPLIPYLTMATGIAFWLRVAKVLSPLLQGMKWVDRIGANTYSVMLHHISGFMVVKWICFFISLLTLGCMDFDSIAFFSDINYVYLPGGAHAFKWVYLLIGLAVPFGINRAVHKFTGYGEGMKIDYTQKTAQKWRFK